MRTSVFLAVLTSAGVMVSGCGLRVRSGDLPPDAGPVTAARPACVPRNESHARICALAPPRRRVGGGNAYKVATVAGERFWVVLPEQLAPSGVVAVPSVPLGVKAHVTTAPSRAAADQYCDGFPACEAVSAERVALPSGAMIRWDDASGTIRGLAVTTVDLGHWTLVMSEVDAPRAERVARALRWTVDGDGYPRVVSADRRVRVNADRAGVTLWVRGLEAQDVAIDIVPGCEESRSDLAPHEPHTVAGGRWCADGRYTADVNFAERSLLELLHQRLRIVTPAEPRRALRRNAGRSRSG